MKITFQNIESTEAGGGGEGKGQVREQHRHNLVVPILTAPFEVKQVKATLSNGIITQNTEKQPKLKQEKKNGHSDSLEIKILEPSL